MGSCGRIELKKQEKFTKMYTQKFRKVNLHLHRKKKRPLLNAKIQRLKNNYEKNIISLDIYWNNIGVICRNLFKNMNVNFKCQLCLIYSIHNSPVIFGFEVLCSFKLMVLIGIVILCSFCIFET